MPSKLILTLLLLQTITAFPIPQHLHPTIPKLPLKPKLSLKETATHIFATITHPTLNQTTTARITVSTNPLAVTIEPVSGRPLRTTIPISKTFANVFLRAKTGAIQVILLKTVQDLHAEIFTCRHSRRETCLKRLVDKICQPVHKRIALMSISCDDDCVQRALEDCQRPDIFLQGAAVITQLIFGCVAAVMVVTYGWGFASAIASIPKELVTFSGWTWGIIQRIRAEGVKLGTTLPFDHTFVK